MLKDAIPLDEIRRALVIKLRHHGDVLLSAPVFSALKTHAPHIEIDALVYADTADMLTQHPAIDQVHVIDRQWKRLGPLGHLKAEWSLAQTLRRRGYDLVIHLTDHPRGAWIVRLCGARWAVTRKIGGRGKWWEKTFTHHFSVPGQPHRHTVEKNLDALRRIGIYPTPAERQLVLVSGSKAENRVATLLADAKLNATPFIHIHPASRWFFKCWPVEKMATLVGLLQSEGHNIVFSGAPDPAEIAMIAAIEARLSQPAINFAGQLSLKELAALTARARLFVGVDSAPMHIAAAMGTPTVALFGPSGDKEWAPWTSHYRIITSGCHPCRPCGLDGCGGGKVSDCLEDLPVDRVHQAARELLAR